jgi:hypothetical protein
VQELARQTYLKVADGDPPQALQQFKFELMPLGLLIALSYGIIALRFFMYWEAQLALAFMGLYIMRGLTMQFTRWAR